MRRIAVGLADGLRALMHVVDKSLPIKTPKLPDSVACANPDSFRKRTLAPATPLSRSRIDGNSMGESRNGMQLDLYDPLPIAIRDMGVISSRETAASAALQAMHIQPLFHQFARIRRIDYLVTRAAPNRNCRPAPTMWWS